MRVTTSLPVLLICVFLSAAACTRYVAKQIVMAPGPDAMMFYGPEWYEEADEQLNIKTLTVPVGPPRAKIVVSIIRAQDYGLKYDAEWQSDEVAIDIDFAPPDERPPPFKSVKGTVLILPGAFMGRYSMLVWGLGLAGHGYQAALMDLRGQGDSTGKYRTYGIVESRDTVQVVAALAQRGLIHQPLVLMGVSLGAATALMAAPEIPGLDAVIALEPYTNATDAIIGVGEEITPWWLNLFVTDERVQDALMVASEMIGHDLDDARPIEAVKSVDIPVLFIHGQADTWVPPQHSIEMYLAKPCCAELWVIPQAVHMDLPLRYETLNQRIFDWLDKVLSDSAPTLTSGTREVKPDVNS